MPNRLPDESGQTITTRSAKAKPSCKSSLNHPIPLAINKVTRANIPNAATATPEKCPMKRWAEPVNTPVKYFTTSTGYSGVAVSRL